MRRLILQLIPILGPRSSTCCATGRPRLRPTSLCSCEGSSSSRARRARRLAAQVVGLVPTPVAVVAFGGAFAYAVDVLLCALGAKLVHQRHGGTCWAVR